MKYFQPQRDDRASLLALVAALDASPKALHREPLDNRNKDDGEAPPYAIHGKSGHIYADLTGYLMYVMTGESARRWNNIKGRLAFCRVTQDGDDEGCLRLDRLPAPHEAAAIRDAIGIKRKRHLSPEARASLADRFSKHPTSGPSGDATSI
jgi:hypothetical protein